ncbi:MAG: helix-turn-helix transcriptional regulator [Saprospiraceae bacterium]|nr:helix-turn-helix transcriptional regulator [Saprospiraceae bacterium]
MNLDTISTREKQVLYLLANEYRTDEIADKLFISPHTVISHRRHLLEKLNVRNTAGMVRVAFECGLLRIPVFARDPYS